MDDGALFNRSDCDLFSGEKCGQKRYNRERKIVANKFQELGSLIQPKLRSEGFKLKYRVSQYYPNPRNGWEVTGIWLAFTGTKQYYNWAQLNVGLYDEGLAIGIEVPRNHKDNLVARRLLTNSATLVANSINKLREYGRVDFSPADKDPWGLDTPIDPEDLISATRKADYGTWITIGEWYNSDDLRSASKLVSRTLTVFNVLKPVFRMMSADTVSQTRNLKFVDESNKRSKRDLVDSAERFLSGQEGIESKEFDVWRKEKVVDWPIKSSPKIVRSLQPRMIAGLDLNPKKVGGEWIQLTAGLPIPENSRIGKLRESVASLVKIMGGNPETVKIMVTNQHTDGRVLDDQLFVNALLTDKSPAFWGIVAARELAGLTTKSYYPHVRRMSILLERLITNGDFLKMVAQWGNQLKPP